MVDQNILYTNNLTIDSICTNLYLIFKNNCFNI